MRPSGIAATRADPVTATLSNDAAALAGSREEVDDDAYFAAWRARELSRVERVQLTYLDYTGAALYPESVVRSDADRLLETVLGNPHSEHAPSREASDDLEEARASILGMLNASPDDYVAVITPNATAAARIVAESFPFMAGSSLALTRDNHNSINGIREHACRRGATLHTIPLDANLRLRAADAMLDRRNDSPSLFALPAQSNFSGVRHDLSLVTMARARGWRVLLDAAAFLPTARLDLAQIPADFVTLSLYKIAGYPTGVGALVARREALSELQRPWFSGGTVAWASVQHRRHRLLAGAPAFEDGTVPFLELGAVRPALDVTLGLDRDRLARHLRCLTGELLAGLRSLRHANRRRVVKIHGPDDAVDRGATVSFTVYDIDGRVIPYWTVEADARGDGIAVRGGCFCNPGCAEVAFGFDDRDTRECLDDLGDAFTIPRFATCLGDAPVGAIRVSLGLGSVRRDVERLLEFLSRYVTG